MRISDWSSDVCSSDLPEGVRRPGLLGAGAPQGDPEDLLGIERGQLHGRRAQLARPGRTAGALRHAGAEGPLPAAPGRRPRSALLRPDRPVRRLRRDLDPRLRHRSEEHTSELQSLMRISYAVFCLKKKKTNKTKKNN